MKKIKVIILSIILILSIIPVQLKAESGSVTMSSPPGTEVESARAKELLSRLDEINVMDKSAMSRSEKRTMRKEVRAIKKELNSLGGGGIYLSVGAVIIIVLLLILLL